MCKSIVWNDNLQKVIRKNNLKKWHRTTTWKEKIGNNTLQKKMYPEQKFVKKSCFEQQYAKMLSGTAICKRKFSGTTITPSKLCKFCFIFPEQGPRIVGPWRTRRMKKEKEENILRRKIFFWGWEENGGIFGAGNYFWRRRRIEKQTSYLSFFIHTDFLRTDFSPHRFGTKTA